MGGGNLLARAAGALRRRRVEPWAAVVGGGPGPGPFPAPGGLLDVAMPAWRAEPVRLRLPDDERWVAHRRQTRALLVANGLDMAPSQRENLALLRELVEGRLPADTSPRVASGLLAVMERLEVVDMEARAGHEVVMRAQAAGVAIELVFRVPRAAEVEERLQAAFRRDEDAVVSFDELVLRWSGYAADPPVFHRNVAALELLKSLGVALREAQAQ